MTLKWSAVSENGAGEVGDWAEDWADACINAAIVRNLRAIVVALQELHADSGDLSLEGGGLLLTFQDSC